MPISDVTEEVFKQGRDNNLASWREMIAFYEYVTTLPVWGERNLPLLRLVNQIAISPIAAQFRAGQSLHNLCISTKPENGLAINDPYIRIGSGAEASMLQIGYWRGAETGDLMASQTVTEDQVINTLKPLLARLRSEAEASAANAPEE